MADGQVELPTIVLSHRSDSKALFAVLAQGGDKSFLTKAMKRAAHGRSADTQTLGDDSLREWRAGWQLSPDYELSELLERVVRVVALSALGPRVLARARGLLPRF